jgi:hypothetical protein
MESWHILGTHHRHPEASAMFRPCFPSLWCRRVPPGPCHSLPSSFFPPRTRWRWSRRITVHCLKKQNCWGFLQRDLLGTGVGSCIRSQAAPTACEREAFSPQWGIKRREARGESSQTLPRSWKAFPLMCSCCQRMNNSVRSVP